MRRFVSVMFALAVVALLLLAASPHAAAGSSAAEARAKRRKPTPCPDQRYVVQGAPLLPGASAPEAIVISGKQISLGSDCPGTAARVALRIRGTKVKAAWPSCTGIQGHVKLAATIDPACVVMNGAVRAPRSKMKAKFHARRTCDAGACQGGTVITVNTTTNTLGDGLCSFEEAVQAANTAAAVDGCPPGAPGATNTIAFDIPGAGIQTIAVATVTQITSSIAIDGTTQPGYAGVPLIRITGSVEDLLRFSIDADGSSLKGLMLTNMNGGGLVDGATALFYSYNNRIVGNYFNTDGVDVVGPHGAGLLFDTSQGNVIGGTTVAERNVFGGQTGVYLQDSSHNLVEGNYFGVQPDGNTALGGLPGNGNGVEIFNVTGNATANTVRGNVITGFLAGVNVLQGSNANVIQGNYIGVGVDGATARGNAIGVLLYGASNNVVGGSAATDRNLISGNSSTNVTVQNDVKYATDGNAISGNYIGSDATGLTAVSSTTLFGVYVAGGATGTAISGNVIDGHQQGVDIDPTSTVAGGSNNCISGNVTYGVHSENAVSAPFANNWWGDASGPRYTGNPTGTGDWVSTNVTFAPFLTSAPAECAGGATLQ